MKRVIGVLIAGAFIVNFACTDSGHGLDCTDLGDGFSNCFDRADGGAGDAQADALVPSGCDLTKSPTESPNCVSDDVGAFVSPTGKDGAAGTKADPMRSISDAIALGKRRVYVCEGEYKSALSIARPVAIFGGLTCSWQSSATAKPRISPPSGVGITVTNVTSAVRLEDLVIEAVANIATPGDSAIGVFVAESKDVTLRNTDVTTGAGVTGATGGTGSNYTAPATNGSGAVDGANAVTCSCLDGQTSSVGGKGGAVGAGGSSGSATPVVGGPNAGFGGETCAGGTVGANGAAKAAGAAGSKAGALTAAGWSNSATDATDGANGNPGQGGGGGGGRTGFAAGGGGACGGCGGGGGQPGASGGSSIAILSYQSNVVVDGGNLKAGAGGAGGKGGAGQDGQTGGSGGIGACDGGPGGRGAGGSGGGGGAGGHSLAIGYAGSAPKVSDATLTPGAPGAGGAGGSAGVGLGNPGNGGTKGADGKKETSLSL